MTSSDRGTGLSAKLRRTQATHWRLLTYRRADGPQRGHGLPRNVFGLDRGIHGIVALAIAENALSMPSLLYAVNAK